MVDASGSDEDAAFIRFRLSHIDVVMSKDKCVLPPTMHDGGAHELARSEYDNRVSPFCEVGDHLRAVPELRIFGATDRGQRVVAHIHGAFPYMYVEYKGKLDPESGEYLPREIW
jgi:DNA polymerase zeta